MFEVRESVFHADGGHTNGTTASFDSPIDATNEAIKRILVYASRGFEMEPTTVDESDMSSTVRLGWFGVDEHSAPEVGMAEEVYVEVWEV